MVASLFFTSLTSSATPDADALAYIARMSTVPTTEQASAYDYFVKQAKSIGAWPYITDCGFLSAQDATSARLGVKNVINLSLVGTAPTHIPGHGTRGSGTNQAFNTGYKFPAGQQNNAHIGIYSLSDQTSDSPDAGNENTTILPRSFSTLNTAFSRLNGATAGTAASTDGLGVFIANRTGALAGDGKLYRRGASLVGTTSASQTPDAVYNLWIGGRNGTTLQYSQRTLAFWTIGTGMPEAVLLAYSLLVEDVCARLSASITVANVTAPTRSLYKYMTQMGRQPSYVLAAFDNTWWNLGTTPNLLADIATITGGKVPGMIGHEWANPLSTGGAAASAAQIVRIRNHYEAGGINTVHMHPGNPVTGSFQQLPTNPGTAGNQYDMTGAPVVACLSGGAKRTEFLAFVDRLIAFFQACTDSGGNPIPIIFRPWHEINGGFFWWSDATQANTIQLWKDTVDRIKAAGVQNVLYSWNTNFTPTPSSAYFPGINYCDFASTDYYENVTNPVGLSNSAAVSAFGGTGNTATTQRPSYLGEIGFQGAADTNTGLWPTKVGAYHRDYMSRSASFMLWRSTFGPTAGGATNAEFATMVSDAACITRDRLSGVYTMAGSTPPAPDTTAPTITSSNPSGSYAENTPISGTLAANEVVTWSKSGTDQALITLNLSTGAWSITTTPDFETKASYSWTFTATDGAGNTTNQVVAITITDVVETSDSAISDLFLAGEQGYWYDPSDLSTMFQDTAGTVPVTTAGQFVARINDKSGRNNHATQSTLANRPTYQVDGTGRKHLLFDAARGDFLVTSTITPGSTAAQIITGIYKASDAASGILVENGNGTGGLNGVLYINAPSLAGANSYRSGCTGSVFTQVGTGTFAPAPDLAVLSSLASIPAPSLQLRRNGTVVDTSTATMGTGGFRTDPVYIGRRGGSSLPFGGRIYGMMYRFGAPLTGGQVSAAETWMNGKTGAY